MRKDSFAKHLWERKGGDGRGCRVKLVFHPKWKGRGVRGEKQEL